jgi:peptidyl-prolyl cis-trans isomerase C
MVKDEDRAKVRAAILDRLVFLKVLTALATPEDKVKGEANTRKSIEDVKARAGTDTGFKRLLQRSGLDEPTFLRLKQEEQTVLVVLDRVLKSKIQVSDEAVAKYYNDEPSKFERPEMIKVAHVLLTTRDSATGKDLTEAEKKTKRAKAEELLNRLKKGEDFAKLARENSEDPGSRNNGGELTIARGQTVVEFEAAASALKAGELSSIVTTQFGYHIIKGGERKAASRLSLAETSKDIREYLIQKEFEKQIPEFTEQLKKEAGLEIPQALAQPK